MIKSLALDNFYHKVTCNHLNVRQKLTAPIINTNNIAIDNLVDSVVILRENLDTDQFLTVGNTNEASTSVNIIGTNVSALQFSDSNTDQGHVEKNHQTGTLALNTNGNDVLTINTSGNVTVDNLILEDQLFASNIIYGTYIPTVVTYSLPNFTWSNGYGLYFRIGSFVKVVASFDANATAIVNMAGTTFTIPFASDFLTSSQLLGNILIDNYEPSTATRLISSPSLNLGQVNGGSIDTTTTKLYLSFFYEIV